MGDSDFLSVFRYARSRVQSLRERYPTYAATLRCDAKNIGVPGADPSYQPEIAMGSQYRWPMHTRADVDRFERLFEHIAGADDRDKHSAIVDPLNAAWHSGRIEALSERRSEMLTALRKRIEQWMTDHAQPPDGWSVTPSYDDTPNQPRLNALLLTVKPDLPTYHRILVEWQQRLNDAEKQCKDGKISKSTYYDIYYDYLTAWERHLYATYHVNRSWKLTAEQQWRSIQTKLESWLGLRE